METSCTFQDLIVQWIKRLPDKDQKRGIPKKVIESKLPIEKYEAKWLVNICQQNMKHLRHVPEDRRGGVGHLVASLQHIRNIWAHPEAMNMGDIDVLAHLATFRQIMITFGMFVFLFGRL